MNRTLIACLACAWMPLSYSGQTDAQEEGSSVWTFWALENRGYFDPLLAEPRAAQITAIVYANSSGFEYQVEQGRRQTWDISLGKEIPLLGLENCGFAGGTISADNDCTGFGLWLPVSFHMIEDFKDESSPIINTDYRFGLMAKVQKVFPFGSLAARFQIGHESTHLGDEFTIHAENAYGAAFERVNVSYEYWEYSLSYERALKDEHILTFRHGGIGLLDNSKGFYGTRLLGSAVDSLTPSTKHFEPTFGAEWQKESPVFKSWAPLASIDLRLKTVYDYHRPPDSADRQKWTICALIGLRHVGQRFTDRGAPIIVGRVYYGVNPHGQFRSQDNYLQWGVGLIVPL